MDNTPQQDYEKLWSDTFKKAKEAGLTAINAALHADMVVYVTKKDDQNDLYAVIDGF